MHLACGIMAGWRQRPGVLLIDGGLHRQLLYASKWHIQRASQQRPQGRVQRRVS
jgi:hypothetical protein